MPGPAIKQYAKPKKGTIKRLFKSLWKHFKFELILSLVTLILSIAVNLCGYLQEHVAKLPYVSGNMWTRGDSVPQ